MTNKHWWKETTIYQIYPLSFYDSNNDGYGDIVGISKKLDYIKKLGFETIWISPFYKSPLCDFGYDISDYVSINPLLGTMKDVEDLIKQVHKRKMKIVFDMVMNHTSNEHDWFKESQKSKDNPKRDWYIWKKGQGKRPPNNWHSMTGTCGWKYDSMTDEWYYASFLSFQPDLNYNNPKVKKAMFDIVNFWLNKGVDGFRLDIFNCIIKDQEFKNNPFGFKLLPSSHDPNAFFQKKVYNLNHPDCYKFAKELRAQIDKHSPERFLIGEVFGDHGAIKNFLGKKNDGLNLIFLFETIAFKFSAKYFRNVIRKFEEVYPEPYSPVYVFGNHDQKRFISKIGNDPEKAKVIATIQFTVRGVPVTYYGEEIGMCEANIPFNKALDPIASKYKFVPKALADFLGLYINRDGCRTPMLWKKLKQRNNAGFSKAKKTWLKVNSLKPSTNVKYQKKNKDSLFHCYKDLIKLRNKYKALKKGNLVIHEHDDSGNPFSKNLLVYTREHKKSKLLIMINFSKKKIPLKNTAMVSLDDKSLLFTTKGELDFHKDKITYLRPLEAIVVEV